MHFTFALSPLSHQTGLSLGSYAITASAATGSRSRERGLWQREWVWTKRGVGHGLGHGLGHGPPYGLSYGLPVINRLNLGSALLLTCVNNIPHESVIPSTLFCPFGGVSFKFSTQTRGRLESEKRECRTSFFFIAT